MAKRTGVVRVLSLLSTHTAVHTRHMAIDERATTFVMGLPLGTVMSGLARARRASRDALHRQLTPPHPDECEAETGRTAVATGASAE